MEEKLIDLTTPEFQGCFGYDIVEELNAPGFYRIPFRNYDKEESYYSEWEDRLDKIAKEHNVSCCLDLPDEIKQMVTAEMEAEGWETHDTVNVHVDKVFFVRGGHFQIIHTTDPNIFKESDWAYYNGAEQLWKDAIGVTEIFDELVEEYGSAEAIKLMN